MRDKAQERQFNCRAYNPMAQQEKKGAETGNTEQKTGRNLNLTIRIFQQKSGCCCFLILTGF